MAKENFNGKIIGSNFNDSTVIGVIGSSEISTQFGSVDSVSLKASDFAEDRTSLGLLTLFENSKIVKVPFISDALKSSDKIYVNGFNGSFDYEIAMEVDKPIVVQNVEEGDYLGVDEATFCIKLSHGYNPGDILTYDPIDGVFVIVGGDELMDGFVMLVGVVGLELL